MILSLRKNFIISFIFIVTISLYSQNQIFQNVTSGMGINEPGASFGQACVWCDIDSDGDLDLAFSYSSGGTFRLYRNDESIFTNVTTSSGLNGISAGSILFGELTGDEYPDLIASGNLYQNNGEGEFSLLSSSGITGTISSMADFDKDGDVDLLSISSTIKILYNDGTGIFSTSLTLPGTDISSSVCFDYNLDGFMDIYLGGNAYGQNILFKNNGDDTFSNVTSSAGVSCSQSTSGVTAGDYNNDGYPDLYLGKHLGQLSDPDNALFKNNGDGTFSDVTIATGTPGEHASTRTVTFVDYNNDGLLDLFVNDHYYGNVLYKNNGNETFTNVAVEMGITGGFGDYFGMTWGDYNNDGAIDIFVTGHFHIYRLYRNDNCPGNYLTIDLKGIESNYSGIDTKIELYVEDQAIHKWVTVGEGMLDFHSLPVEFGLGDNEFIDSLRIVWSNNNSQVLYNVNANQRITIEEGSVVIADNPISSISNFQLKQNFPNPFNPSTTISFETTNLHENIRIEIYNLKGQKVKTLPVILSPESSLRKGSAIWNGTDENDQPVTSGIYFYKLNINGKTEAIKKCLLLK